MQTQKPYIPLFSLKEAYPHFEETCLLCQNIAQARDAREFPDVIRSNLIIDLESHLILPNRYPSLPGASLFLAKAHDDLSCRTSSKEGASESNKTRGRVPPSDELEVLFICSDKFGFVALRNHVFAGMSIPFHDHFHLLPHDLDIFKPLKTIINQNARRQRSFELKCTPFATLAIYERNYQKLAQYSAAIIEAFEQQNIAFTLVYFDGYLLITPRSLTTTVQNYSRVGSAAPIHCFNAPLNEAINEAICDIPKVGDFAWKDYIDL